MKAAVVYTYGAPDVVQIANVAKPSPKPNEILVKVVATTVTAGDARIRAARFPKGFAPFARLAFGVTKPRIAVPGICFSGIVEEIGSAVTEFAVGDEVCGTSGMKMGAHAEYVTAHAKKSVALKPKKISHIDAAGMIFGGTAALYFIRDKAKVAAGNAVLINGASGAVGTNAVQLASHYGANVTGVTSAANTSLVKGLGAEQIIDYEKQSVFEVKDRYDVVLDTVGNISIKAGLPLLKPSGKLVLMVASLGQILRSTYLKHVVTGTATDRAEDIAFLLSLMEQGHLKTVVDTVYPFADIAKAHQHVDSGKKTGNVIVSLV